MFWSQKDKGKKPPSTKTRDPFAEEPKSAGQKSDREKLLAKARATATLARAEIGDETLEKIKEALMKKQGSAIEKAKAQIKNANADKVRDNIKFMIKEDK